MKDELKSMKQNHLKYLQIRDQTYSIFEIYHRQALASIFKSNVSAKDLALIKSIAALKEATPSKITNLTGVSPTNLSNRLAYLETQHLIERTKNIIDQRKYIVTLTPSALDIIEQYQTYLNDFFTYVKKNLNFKEKLIFNHFLTNWKKIKTIKESDNTRHDFNVIDDIENFFINKEFDFFADEKVSFTFSDLSFLSSLYLNEVVVQLSLPKLADTLFIPYQTLVSKINRFVQEGHITKDKKKLTFSAELIHAVDQFMMLRIINYYEALRGASLKEQEVVIKVFALLKDYASSFIQK